MVTDDEVIALTRAERNRRHTSPRQPGMSNAGYRYAIRQDIMRSKKSAPCADCGKSFHPDCMDFDHRDPLDKYGYHGNIKINTLNKAMRRLNSRFFLEELDKCDVVCANCHRVRELARSTATPTSELSDNKHTSRARRRIARRYDEIQTMKSVPCADCGNTYPSVCMDFDHCDPTTKLRTWGTSKIANVSDLVRAVSWDRVLAELRKCDIVCAVCHRLREYARRIAVTG